MALYWVWLNHYYGWLNHYYGYVFMSNYAMNMQTPYPDKKAGGFTYNDSTFDIKFYNLCQYYDQFIAYLPF